MQERAQVSGSFGADALRRRSSISDKPHVCRVFGAVFRSRCIAILKKIEYGVHDELIFTHVYIYIYMYQDSFKDRLPTPGWVCVYIYISIHLEIYLYV